MTALDDAVSLAAAKLEKATVSLLSAAKHIADMALMDLRPDTALLTMYREAVDRRDAAWVAHRDALAARRDVYVPQQRGSES